MDGEDGRSEKNEEDCAGGRNIRCWRGMDLIELATDIAVEREDILLNLYSLSK